MNLKMDVSEENVSPVPSPGNYITYPVILSWWEQDSG